MICLSVRIPVRWRDIAPTYGEAVVLIFAKLSEQRKGRFYNYRDGQLGSSQLRESTRKVSMIQKLREEQKGSKLLVVQAQFGLRHRGRSVRRARAVMGGNEFSLGAFEIGIMLLTHPDRLKHYDDLWIDCGGDEYAPESDGVFSGAPFFDVDGESLRFDAGDIDDANGRYGLPSPKSHDLL